MAVIALQLGSERAAKARVTRWLNRSMAKLLMCAAVILVACGVALLVVGESYGWIAVGCATLPWVFAEWYKGELRSLPAAPKGNSMDAWLDAEILAKLHDRMTPKQVAEIVGEVNAGQFMAVRFGVTANFLLNIASEDVVAIDDLWTTARDIQQQTKSPLIHGAVLAAALVQQYPAHDTLLAQMKLEMDDLIEGVRWYNHVQQLVNKSTQKRRTGGVARDWSFGYVPLLQRFGINLSAGGDSSFITETPGHTQALGRLIEAMSVGGRQNAAVVGASGVGKTTLLRAFANRLLDAEADVPSNLKFRQVYLLDSSALIAAAPGRGELEGLVMRVLGEAYRAKNIIICLDDAQLFFEEGVGSVDLTNVLLPILEAGNLRVILTMDEQRFLQIGQRNASLTNALNRIVLTPSSESETIAVLQDKLIMTEFQHKVTYMYQSLKTAFRLSERYVHEIDMPGRAIKLLESAASYAEMGKLVTANSVEQAIEQTMNIKVATASASEERETLLNLEDKIHERMINQTRAVQVVSDALRRARAGVRNQERPIGTFLFLGPTGVGKTELAKALADVYFGGADRMIRLDLNEYVTLDDVSRLIADGADDPHSLTAQVMKQPFSVVLLDEIEKAHPNVLTTLLQLLDEGVLRDIKNREVSFRDAIVIATSNAGADRIREYIERGYQLAQFEQQFQDELINSNQFKPEFLNRFDEVVVFTPLGKTELLQVIDLIIAGVNKTLALQKVSVAVDDDAKTLLVDRGYDPRLGARPMRRVVQRAVENTVAKEMLGGNVAAGSTITITRAQVEQALGVEAPAETIPPMSMPPIAGGAQ